ncbi:MAG: hypothetical protein JWN67_1863, partial [Actinomycetia bacterium]|nr:hypothetical protein [Actinomycetes bacterium]
MIQRDAAKGLRVAAALAVAGGLAVTTGCGARWNDRQQDAVLARSRGGAAVAPGPGDQGST